jgi:hypothetical protein
MTVEEVRQRGEEEVRLRREDPARWLETVGRNGHTQLGEEGGEGEVAGD